MRKVLASTKWMARVIVFVLLVLFLSDTLLFHHEIMNWGALHSQGDEYWRIITASFLHTNVLHLLGNCLMLGYIGYLLQDQLTGLQLLLIFMVTNIITYALFMNVWSFTTSVGASPGIYGCIAVWLVSLWKQHILISRVWQKPTFYYVMLYFVVPQLLGLASCFVHGIGFLIGVLIGLLIKETTRA